jgi:hypothetical protein
MHVYGHQWPCQVVYNPRFQKGIGLTDGEAVERFWSKMMIIIGVERNSAVNSHCATVLVETLTAAQRSRRLWLIDRQSGAIADEVCFELGAWLSRQLLSNIPAHRKACEEQLIECGVSPDELRQEWVQQLKQQKSVSSCKSSTSFAYYFLMSGRRTM